MRIYLIKKISGSPYYCVFSKKYWWQKWKLMRMSDGEYSEDIGVTIAAFKKRNLAEKFKLKIEL